MIQPNADRYLYLVKVEKPSGTEYYNDSGMPHQEDHGSTTPEKQLGRRFTSAISAIAVIQALRDLGEHAAPAIFDPYDQHPWKYFP